MAPYYSEQAKSARNERDDWAREVRRLIDLSKSLSKPVNNNNWSAFNTAKSNYYAEKDRHSKIQQEYNSLKDTHNQNTKNVESCQAEFDQAKKAVDDYRIAGQKDAERIKAENDARWAELERIAQDAADRHVEKGRKIQYSDRGADVKVKSGYDERHHCIVTDIIVTDKYTKIGKHLHIVIDEYGNELFRHTKSNKVK